jgi:D-serine deaminase-like pyridoxal phosphate-dependent protein
MQPRALSDLPTPCLILDEARMERNIQRLRLHAQKLGVTLRPHLKTSKSVEVARRTLEGGNGPATVSTLKEAEVFFAAGITDILYAVGIVPDKLARVSALRRAGCDLAVILDSLEQADAVVAACRQTGDRIGVLIEIDTDEHRSGLAPDSPDIVAVGRRLHEGGADLRGVLTHAGESYNAVGAEALTAFAELERAGAVQAAEALRAAGLPCPVVSVGSTPTAHFAKDLTGVTEVRAGVHVFFDLVMAGIGVCTLDDIAASVLATVIGHQKERGWIITDAGWMAMSRDRGTASQQVDQGYGVVCDVTGAVIPDLIATGANQEHSILSLRPGSSAELPSLPIGTKLRILPNHACATAAQHDAYWVVPEDERGHLERWSRFNHW